MASGSWIQVSDTVRMKNCRTQNDLLLFNEYEPLQPNMKVLDIYAVKKVILWQICLGITYTSGHTISECLAIGNPVVRINA